jgi:hypothetical protein
MIDLEDKGNTPRNTTFLHLQAREGGGEADRRVRVWRDGQGPTDSKRFQRKRGTPRRSFRRTAVVPGPPETNWAVLRTHSLYWPYYEGLMLLCPVWPLHRYLGQRALPQPIPLTRLPPLLMCFIRNSNNILYLSVFQSQ